MSESSSSVVVVVQAKDSASSCYIKFTNKVPTITVMDVNKRTYQDSNRSFINMHSGNSYQLPAPAGQGEVKTSASYSMCTSPILTLSIIENGIFHVFISPYWSILFKLKCVIKLLHTSIIKAH